MTSKDAAAAVVLPNASHGQSSHPGGDTASTHGAAWRGQNTPSPGNGGGLGLNPAAGSRIEALLRAHPSLVHELD